MMKTKLQLDLEKRRKEKEEREANGVIENPAPARVVPVIPKRTETTAEQSKKMAVKKRDQWVQENLKQRRLAGCTKEDLKSKPSDSKNPRNEGGCGRVFNTKVLRNMDRTEKSRNFS